MKISKTNTLAAWSKMNLSVETLLKAVKPHIFITRFLECIEFNEGYFNDFVRLHQENYFKAITNVSTSGENNRIPGYFHRLWITDMNNPSMPPDRYIEGAFANAKSLPSEIVHMIWTNNSRASDYVVDKARSLRCLNICVMDIESLSDDPTFEIVLRLVSARKFVLAADVLKIIILYRHGGIYGDLGIRISETVYRLIRSSDFAFLMSESMFFQTSFMASPPKSPLMTAFRSIINHPDSYDRKFCLIGKRVSPLDDVHTLAGPGFTVAAILFHNSVEKTLIVPANHGDLEWSSEKSWYGDIGKHGNVLISTTEATVLNDDEFQFADEVLERQLFMIGDFSIVLARLRVLLRSKEILDSSSSPFKKYLEYVGVTSNEYLSRVAYIYDYLLCQLPTDRIALLSGKHLPTEENDIRPSVVSQIGLLHVWRNFFPKSEVSDLSENIDVLTNIDKLNEDKYSEPVRSSSMDCYNVFVDSTKGSFNERSQTFSRQMPHVKPQGIYIIENIEAELIDSWKDFLVSERRSGIIISLPYSHGLDHFIIIKGSTSV